MKPITPAFKLICQLFSKQISLNHLYFWWFHNSLIKVVMFLWINALSGFFFCFFFFFVLFLLQASSVRHSIIRGRPISYDQFSNKYDRRPHGKIQVKRLERPRWIRTHQAEKEETFNKMKKEISYWVTSSLFWFYTPEFTNM